ncbi:MAG: PqqD family protein [Pseudonocardiales bacterium]|nr:PqqD family protein [Pseudonocardiales bacterium]
MPMRSYLPRESVRAVPTATGALVLLDTRSGRLFQLNPTGATAWNALVVAGGDIPSAVRTVAHHYGQPYQQVLDDLWGLIQRLVEISLMDATHDHPHGLRRTGAGVARPVCLGMGDHGRRSRRSAQRAVSPHRAVRPLADAPDPAFRGCGGDRDHARHD